MFIHLFSSIPAPQNFLSELNSLLYQFLRNDKPDKIKRAIVCLDYFGGGLKMVNIYNYEKSLKVSWMQKLVLQKESQWSILVYNAYKNFGNILTMGPYVGKQFLAKVKNQFGGL